MSLLPYLHRVCLRQDLSAEDAEAAMNVILAGEASTPLITGFLVALRMKGETADEIYGLAKAMRSRGVRVDSGVEGMPMVDTCGTGGDSCGTFNISTVAGFVVAGAGVYVAKHGNRSISSQCGSADILEAMGVRIDLSPAAMGECIRKAGIGFLFAPALHPAMRHAQPARVELKMRTAFNLLGPLTNPAGAKTQLLGAPTVDAARLMAGALSRLGVSRAFVVHGSDGLDEITTTGPTTVFEVSGVFVRELEVTPTDFGVPAATLAELQGGSRETNRDIAWSILEGERGARRDIVQVNAAAALVAAGVAADFREGMSRAGDSLDSGSARAAAKRLVETSQGA